MHKMEKLIALTFVVAIVSFVGAYALSAWKGKQH
jgi:type II secretory pathway pseudopilin PulG